MNSQSHPQLTSADDERVVHLQSLNRCTPRGCHPNDVRSIERPAKMILPAVVARMDRTTSSTGLCIAWAKRLSRVNSGSGTVIVKFSLIGTFLVRAFFHVKSNYGAGTRQKLRHESVIRQNASGANAGAYGYWKSALSSSHATCSQPSSMAYCTNSTRL